MGLIFQILHFALRHQQKNNRRLALAAFSNYSESLERTLSIEHGGA